MDADGLLEITAAEIGTGRAASVQIEGDATNGEDSPLCRRVHHPSCGAARKCPARLPVSRGTGRDEPRRMRLCAIILLATACTHHPQTTSLLPAAHSVKAVAELRDGREVDVVATPSRDPARLLWVRTTTETGKIVDPADMRGYTTIHRGRGALEGLAIVGLSGIALGALIGLSSGNDHCADDSVCLVEFKGNQKAVIYAFGLGALGTGLGALIGAAVGSRDAHTLDTKYVPRVTPTLAPGRAGGALSWSF